MRSLLVTRLLRPALWLMVWMLFAAGTAEAAPQQVPVPPAFMGSMSNYLYPHLHNLVWDAHVAGRVFATSLK